MSLWWHLCLSSILHYIVPKMHTCLWTCGCAWKFKLAKRTLLLYLYMMYKVLKLLAIQNLLFTLLNVTLTRSCKLCNDIFSYKFTSFPNEFKSTMIQFTWYNIKLYVIGKKMNDSNEFTLYRGYFTSAVLATD